MAERVILCETCEEVVDVQVIDGEVDEASLTDECPLCAEADDPGLAS